MDKLLKNFDNLSREKRELVLKRLREQKLISSTYNEHQASPILATSRNRPIPLSYAQQRLWFLNQLEPENPSYNLHTLARLTGALNVAAMGQTFNEILRRHEALRTTFSTVDGGPVQVISPEINIPIRIVDLQGLSEKTREAEARRLASAELRQPFNLNEAPLLRCTLLLMGDKDNILLPVMHHIASDGWSMGVLFRELSSLDETFSAGEPSSLPELSIQYADFTFWQRQRLQGKVLETQLSYWKRQLAGKLPVLELPADRPRPPVQTFQGAIHSFTLPESLSKTLKALSRQKNVTIFMTLLAAFKVLLHRYTGQDDIIVGTPIANRNRSEIEDLIGFFVNTIVLRTDLSANPDFYQLLDSVRTMTLGAYAHQDLPFEKLVEELQPERDMSHSPLFQVMFVLQNSPMETFEFSGLTSSPFEVTDGTAKYDLTLYMWETPDRLAGVFEYNTDLFDFTTIVRMGDHFQTLLEGIVANPEQRLSDLPLLTDAERHQLLVEWNDTQIDYPQDKCIHQLFEEQVENTPDAIAVVFEDQQLSYRELNRRANQLAHHLRKLGVDPDVLVGICVERSIEMVIGLLGILKAGGAYVPLDPTYPKKRLGFMLDDSQVTVLLIQERLLRQLPNYTAHVVCLDRDWQMIGKEDIESPLSNVLAENLAYVIYTSGSTGKPKGSKIPHFGISNRLRWMQDTYQLTEIDQVLQKTPFSFDVSVWEFFWPLLTGARLVVAKPDGHKDSIYMVKLITECRISTVHFVPSMLQIFLDAQEVDTCNCLRHVICSGEALSFKLKERFLSHLDANLHNLYGPTEASVDVTYHACGFGNYLSIVPIGRPISNIQIFILNQRLRMAPIGMLGELHIGGVGLARGYLGRPNLTAERFIPNPFSDEPGTRLYRTGDLARYLPDSNIEFIGRIDNQVKIHGFRIELGEIESVLRQHLSVKEAVVIIREDQPDDKRLVAYLVMKKVQVLDIGKLRDFLKEKLPDYMIPSAFVVLEALPLTPNGKVDRKALPAPDRTGLEAGYVAPRTSTEEILAGVWADVLGVEKVGIHDNFFDIGANSMLIIKVHSVLRKTFKQEISVIDIFKHSTISALAKYLSHEQAEQHPLKEIQERTRKQKHAIKLQQELIIGRKIQ